MTDQNRSNSTETPDHRETETMLQVRSAYRRSAIIAASALLLSIIAGTGFYSSQTNARGRLRAKVYITQKSIPRKLSERGVIGYARKHRAKRLAEDRSRPIKKRYWEAQLVTSFNAPPGDLEFQILFYDLSGGDRKFLSPALSTFINDRKQRTFVQRIRLTRPQFRPNSRIEAVVTVRRAEVGRFKFELTGDVPQRSGEVDFTDE